MQCPSPLGQGAHLLWLHEGRTGTTTTSSPLLTPVTRTVSNCHLQGRWLLVSESLCNGEMTSCVHHSAGVGWRPAEPDSEVAHAGRGRHLRYSPSQESDFNATKQGIASFCHQFGVARAVHG